MNRFAMPTVILSAAILLSGSAQAMEIEKFDRMAAQDQSGYIVVLIEGAQKVLIQSGKKDLAHQVHMLFTKKLGGDESPVGVVEFESNLGRARAADLRNLEKNPNAQRLEVEDAMGVTLKKNGIELPNSFFTVGSAFRPKLPPLH
jgi:hypothetical protein